MANENQSVQAAGQPAAATGSMLDPLMDGERLLPRHMIAVEEGDANRQLNRLVAAIKAETEESLSTLELRLAELTAAIKRRSDVELALTRAEKLIDCFRASVTPVETKFLRPAHALLP
jgi:hypothetical protein